MSIEIRPLSSADHDAWLGLWHGYLEFYEHSLSAEQCELTFARILDEAYPMWGAVALDGTTPIGIVHWLTHSSTWSSEPYCYLEDLFVAPDARAAGVGRRLIEHVTSWARREGLPKVYWQTAYTNSTARRLYERVATNEFIVYEVALD